MCTYIAMYIMCFYFSERFSKPDWRPQIPAGSCLTENDIDKFLDCMLPSLQQAMFAKAHFVTAAVAMQNLALLRPERVLPDLIEKLENQCHFYVHCDINNAQVCIAILLINLSIITCLCFVVCFCHVVCTNLHACISTYLHNNICICVPV